MLNGVVQQVNDANEKSAQTVQPYQSPWLAHWKRTGCGAPGDSTSPSASRSEGLDYVARKDGSTKGVEASSRSANGGLTKKITFEIGDDFVAIGRKSMANHRTIGSLDDRDADPLSRLNPLKESFVKSSSHILTEEFDVETDKFDKGKAAASVGSRQRSASMRVLEHERCCEHMQIDLLCERKVGSPSQSDNSLDECLREISCDHCLSMLNRAWFLKMQKSSGTRLFPSQSNSSEENETTKSHIDYYSHLKLQKCDHGLGTMRIRTGVEVPGGMCAGFSRFSQTTTDLLIEKKSDVNAFKENDTYRSKRVISKFNGNLSDDIRSVLPLFGQNKKNIPLQALSSLKDSEVKEYMGDVKASTVTIRNELSAETDTMDMDSLKEKQCQKSLHSASYSTATALTKAFNMESNDVVSSRKVWQGRLNYKLPDINLELPALTAASLPQNTCPSSSKTLTLETDELLEHVKQPAKVKSNFSLDEFLHADGANRWVKRLKLSSSNSSIQGTKRPNYASTMPHERTSKLFNGIPRSNATGSKPNLSNHHNERSLFSKIDEDRITENPNDEVKALVLSHAWIQRWLHSGSRRATKRGSEIEQESSKLAAAEKLEKEHFPSIAAMALMSKVLTCFQQCELQNKGSYTVWNTKTV